MAEKRVSAFKSEGAKYSRATKKKQVEKPRASLIDTEKNKGGLKGAVGYTLGRAGTDFLRVGEGVVDAALVPVDLLTGNVDRAKSRFMDSPVDAMRERLDEEYNPGKGMQVVGDIAGGIGQSAGYGLISAIPYAGTPMMYSSIVEQGISSAAKQTGDVGFKEIAYGATTGAIEGALESKLGAGVKGVKSLGSAILKKTGLNVAESAAKAGGKTMLKSVLTETAKGAAGEFAEEAISEAVDPALLRLYNIDENAQFSLKDVAYAGLIGGLSGGIMSAGPAAINYRSAVSVGRALQESRLDGELIKRARYTLSALEAAQTRSAGQIKGKPEGDTKETAKERLSRTTENRKVKRLSKETAQLADKIRRNIQAYENSMKDPAMAQSEPVAAILGELRGNLFLVGYSYEADVIEQVMMAADDKKRQAFVDAVNEVLAAQGKKHDYTLADFDANKDDIRRGLAGRLMLDELQGDTAEGGAEATEKPAQAATSPWDGMADNEDVSIYKATGEAEEALLRAAVNQSVPRGSVQAMLDEYRKGTDLTPEEFAEGWSDGVHIFGRFGINPDTATETAYNRLPQSAKEASVRIGRETDEAETKAKDEAAKQKKNPAPKPEGKEKREGKATLGESFEGKQIRDALPKQEQFEAYKAAEILAANLGTDIVIESTLADTAGKTTNGYYDRKTNTIYININAKRNGKSVAVYTLAHEVTHYIKEWSPAKFKTLSDFVMDKLGGDAETLIDEKLALLRKIPDYKDYTVAELTDLAAEEVVADGMELVLTDGKVLEELAHTDRSLWEKVKAWISNIIAKIKKHYGELNQASKTAQVLKETVESLEEIERLFTEGVREAGERTRTAEIGEVVQGEGDVVYHLRDAILTLGEYDSTRRRHIESSDRDRIVRNYDEIRTFIQDAPNKKEFERIHIGIINPETADLVLRKTGQDIREYDVVLSNEFIAHIFRQHGNQRTETPRNQIAVTTRNIEDLVEAMIAPDDVKADVADTGPALKFEKTVGNTNVALTITSKKKGTLTLKSAWIIENSGGRTPSSNADALENTPETNSRSSTKVSIAQPEESVNRKFSISEENSSDIRYSIDETPENADVSDSAFDEALRRAGLSHLVEETAETEDTETTPPPRKAPREQDPEEDRLERIRAHETLANALMEAAQNEHEFRLVKNYQQKAAELADAEVRKEDLRKKTAEVNREIDTLQSKLKGVDKTKREPWVMTALTDAQKRKGELIDEMNALDEKLRTETDKLLSLASAKQLRKMIRTERSKAAAMERSAERARESADKRVERAKAEYEAREEYKENRREMSVRERVARRVVGRMNTMFYNPTKTKHVPADLQALVEAVLKSEKLDTFKETRKNLRQMAEMESEIEKLEQNPARTAKEQEKLDKLHYKYAMFEDEGMDAKSQAVALYTAFKEWMERRPPALQDKDLLEQMSADIDAMQDMPLSVMSMKSLEAVEDFYKEIYHQVNTANQAFATEKATSIDQMSTEANTQVKNAKELKFLSPRSREWAALAGIRSFIWKNMKPLTVFEAIGSDKLMEIFRRVLDAEDVWITDVLEAKKVLDEAKKKHGYNKWNLKERREITTADGSKVSLTLGEMMSLYAYMFREQAEEHLSAGGFVFAPNAEAIEDFKGDKVKYRTHLNDQKPHRMRKEDIAKMSDVLTEEQRAYAKAVQEYLTSLGAKGNEVSRKLYGIDLFKETAYFPIKSSHDYIETSTGKSGDPNIKSRGTFKETVPRAGNPIVLEDFMEVVGNHVNTMATYHAFVLPVEDLIRVWNYTPVNIKRDENGKAILDENGMPVADTEGEAGYNSLKAEITKKYGKEANDYILQLLRDLNGGARRESAASILDKGLTAFKRSATMLSLSTIVQQPTSIIRAMAYVDAKHFTGASFVPWDTVKKYAPVAAIKEMGGFDTGTGARTSEYINAKQYDSIKDAAKAAVTPEIYGGDPNVRAEAFGWLTGKADEVSWRYMFGAIVNEQAEKLGKAKDSEEVLKAAGERFAEVVRRTQVYDSTLTRSEFMRSKDGLMKMATAFGAEPTTILSMAAEAIVKLERGDKAFFRKTAGAVAASILVNAVISSIIYAMRDDDEEKNLLEKYTESVTSEIIEGFNPLEYLPIARDVMSVFKGYDIERTDMSLISNLYQQIELLTSSKRSPADKIAGVSGAVGAFFGLPITNVYRDAKGIVLTTAGILDPEPVTGRGMGNAVGQGIKGQTGLLGKIFGKERGDSYELYQAYVKGDKAHYDRVAARYKTEADLEYALRRELRENDKRIVEAAEAKHSGDLAVYESIVDQIEAEGIFDRNIVIRAINNEVSELKRAAEKGELVPKDELSDENDEEPAESLYTASDLNAALERGDSEDFATIMDALVEDKVSTGKTEAQAKASVKSAITSYWKKQYLSGYQDTETRKRIIKLLTDTGLYGSRNDVATMCEGWVKASK